MTEQLKGFRGTQGKATLCDRGDYSDYDGDCRMILGDSQGVIIGVVFDDYDARLFAKSYELALFVQKVANFRTYPHSDPDGSLRDMNALNDEARALLASVIGDGK